MVYSDIIAQCEWDFYHSPCARCEYGNADNCQHYYGNGCVNELDEEGE